jgi:transposase
MHFRSIDRKTAYLLPPSVEEWLPQDHLARFIVEVVEGLDLIRLEQGYAGRGSTAYHPAQLLSLLVYGYATGVFSSRKIESATYDSVAFRFIAAGSHPDHDTLAAFRRCFLDELSGIFVQVLELAQEMKLLKLGTLSLDGTKVHANASRHSALSHGHIEKIEAQLKGEVQELLALAGKPGGKPPKPPAPGIQSTDQINLTDEESRIMPVSGGGFEQAYNTQAAVDTDSLLVVAEAVTQATNDKEQIVPMLEQLAALPKSLGKVDQLLADTGFFSGKNVVACEEAGIEPLIAVARDEHHARWRERFTEPAPLSASATPAERMAHRLRTKAGRAAYALRKQTVEPVFGIIKSVLGFRQFLLRGLNKVCGEWRLVCLAWNLKRMAALRLQT